MNGKTFKKLENGHLVDQDGVRWRPMTEEDHATSWSNAFVPKIETIVVYDPETFDFRRLVRA